MHFNEITKKGLWRGITWSRTKRSIKSLDFILNKAFLGTRNQREDKGITFGEFLGEKSDVLRRRQDVAQCFLQCMPIANEM